MDEIRFTCVCGCVSWNIINKRIKCINPTCRNEYTLDNIENSESFNKNRNHFLTSEYNINDVGRVYYGSKNKN
jgi:hypothetical protein